MSNDASNMQSTFARRLEEQLRLKRFFSRLLSEVVQLEASELTFQSESDHTLVYISVQGSERKRIKVGVEWYPLIVRWLEQRWAPSLTTSSSEGFSIAQANSFPLQVREGAHTIQGVVVRGGARVRLEKVRIMSSRKAFRQLGAISEGIAVELESVASREYGVIVVAAPRVQELHRAVSAVLGLSGGFYGGDLSEKTVQKLAFHLGQKELILVSYEAPSIADALHAFEKHFEFDWISMLAGVVGISCVPGICEQCATSIEVSPELASKLPVTLPTSSARIRNARGCPSCEHQGTCGWKLLVQAKNIDEDTRNFLETKPGKSTIKDFLSSVDFVSFPEQGLRLVHAGVISPKTLGTVFAPFQDLASSSSGSIEIDDSFFTAEPVERSAQNLKESQVFTAGMMQQAFPHEGEGSIANGRSGVRRKDIRILVAEDDQSQRELLEIVFEKEGYSVTAVQNGLEALGLLKTLRPHLIVTDIMMPKLNGAELIAEIKADPELAGIPILVLTVLTDSDREYQLLDMGVDDYCEKTVQRKVLLKRIENLLRRFYRLTD
jgi:CheY-like chemotaxis protein